MNNTRLFNKINTNNNTDKVLKYFIDAQTIENILFPHKNEHIYMSFCIIKQNPYKYTYSYDNNVKTKDVGYGKLVLNINDKFVYLSDERLVIMIDADYSKLLSIKFPHIETDDSLYFCSISNNEQIRSKIIDSIINANYNSGKGDNTQELISSIFKKINKGITLESIKRHTGCYIEYLLKKQKNDPLMCIVNTKIKVVEEIIMNDEEYLNYANDDQYTGFLRAFYVREFKKMFIDGLVCYSNDKLINSHTGELGLSCNFISGEHYLTTKANDTEYTNATNIKYIELSVYKCILKYLKKINHSTHTANLINHSTHTANLINTITMQIKYIGENHTIHIPMKKMIKSLDLNHYEKKILNNALNILQTDENILLCIMICFKFNKIEVPQFIYKLILSFF